MSSIWQEAERLFSNDDGSLPEIAFTVDDAKLVSLAYQRLRGAASHLESDRASYWSKSKQAEVPISMGDNPALALVSGDAEPFHVVFGGIKSSHEHLIPPLGVYCFVNELAIDYKMGPEWTEESVLGLFALLDDLAQIFSVHHFEHRENINDSDSQLLNIWHTWRKSNAP